MKILFCGSFRFLDEMKKTAQRLEVLGFECFLPKFSLGDFSSRKIEKIKKIKKKKGFKKREFKKIIKVTKWFYERLKESDVLIVFNKQGYVGLSLAAEIGVAHILKKPTIFLAEPKDAGLKALLGFSKNFKIIPLKKLIPEFKNLFLV